MELRRTRREGAQLSLQEPLEGSEGQLTLADTLPDPAVMEDDCERRADAARLRRMVETLPVREKEVLILRYGLDGRPTQTQQEVAQRLGISRSYVSRRCYCKFKCTWIDFFACRLPQRAWRNTSNGLVRYITLRGQ